MFSNMLEVIRCCSGALYAAVSVSSLAMQELLFKKYFSLGLGGMVDQILNIQFLFQI